MLVQELAFPYTSSSCFGTAGVPIVPLDFIDRSLLPVRNVNITRSLLVSGEG